MHFCLDEKWLHGAEIRRQGNVLIIKCGEKSQNSEEDCILGEHFD